MRFRAHQPSIIILDDLQNIVSKEDSTSQNVLEALEEELDSLYGQDSSATLPKVIVAAATLQSSSVPMSLKGLSRFSTEIALSVPDANARKAILKWLAPPIVPEVREEVLDKLGDRTHAYTAKDLVVLLATAGKLAEKDVDRTAQDWREKEHFLSQDNIEEALLLVRPTAMHDITLKPPSVRWDDIGGQETVKRALRRAVETPLKVMLTSSLFYLSPLIDVIVPCINETCWHHAYKRTASLWSSRLLQDTFCASHGNRSWLQLLCSQGCGAPQHVRR